MNLSLGFSASTLDIILALVAVYGAVLSTYVFLHERKKSKPSLMVTTSWGLPVYNMSLSDEVNLIITAANNGHLPATVSGVGLVRPDGEEGQIINVPSEFPLPHELLPGQSCTFFLKKEEIADELRNEGFSGGVKIGAFCRTQLDKKYYSKKRSIDLS